MRQVYQAPGKPPNVVELQPKVRELLATRGYRASSVLIRKVADEEEFQKLRRPRGKTVLSESKKTRL
jgi:hypothetical protein